MGYLKMLRFLLAAVTVSSLLGYGNCNSMNSRLPAVKNSKVMTSTSEECMFSSTETKNDGEFWENLKSALTSPIFFTVSAAIGVTCRNLLLKGLCFFAGLLLWKDGRGKIEILKVTRYPGEPKIKIKWKTRRSIQWFVKRYKAKLESKEGNVKLENAYTTQNNCVFKDATEDTAYDITITPLSWKKIKLNPFAAKFCTRDFRVVLSCHSIELKFSEKATGTCRIIYEKGGEDADGVDFSNRKPKDINLAKSKTYKICKLRPDQKYEFKVGEETVIARTKVLEVKKTIKDTSVTLDWPNFDDENDYIVTVELPQNGLQLPYKKSVSKKDYNKNITFKADGLEPVKHYKFTIMIKACKACSEKQHYAVWTDIIQTTESSKEDLRTGEEALDFMSQAKAVGQMPFRKISSEMTPQMPRQMEGSIALQKAPQMEPRRECESSDPSKFPPGESTPENLNMQAFSATVLLSGKGLDLGVNKDDVASMLKGCNSTNVKVAAKGETIEMKLEVEDGEKSLEFLYDFASGGLHQRIRAWLQNDDLYWGDIAFSLNMPISDVEMIQEYIEGLKEKKVEVPVVLAEYVKKLAVRHKMEKTEVEELREQVAQLEARFKGGAKAQDHTAKSIEGVLGKINLQKNEPEWELTGSSGKSGHDEQSESPDIFISYHWDTQPQIEALYKKLTEQGYTCWLDIMQMKGGDALYDKIIKGLKGCKVVLSGITKKYSSSVNCRREVSLADAFNKPIVPLMLEKMSWPPEGPMGMVFAPLLYINFCKPDVRVEDKWEGQQMAELTSKIEELMPATQKNKNKGNRGNVKEQVNGEKKQPEQNRRTAKSK